MVKILTHLSLTIAPLTRIVSSDEELLESFMARDPAEWRRRGWEREHAAREAAWHTPAAMVTTLDALLEATRNLPALVSRLGISDSYFDEGIFANKLENRLRFPFENGLHHQIPSRIPNGGRDRWLMRIDSNILGVIHEGAPGLVVDVDANDQNLLQAGALFIMR